MTHNSSSHYSISVVVIIINAIIIDIIFNNGQHLTTLYMPDLIFNYVREDFMLYMDEGSTNYSCGPNAGHCLFLFY